MGDKLIAKNEEGINSIVGAKGILKHTPSAICTYNNMENTSKQQNKMLHALFKDWSKALCDEGITMQELIKDSFEMYPTADSIKYLFKQLSDKAFGIKSTQKLSNEQINTLLDMFIKKLGGFGIETNLPE